MDTAEWRLSLILVLRQSRMEVEPDTGFPLKYFGFM